MKNYKKKIVCIIALIVFALSQVSLLFNFNVKASTTNSKGKTVYFKLPTEWTGRTDASTGETLLPAAYVAGGNDGPVALWVGERMTKVPGTEDIYSYTIPGDQTFIIFNTGKEKDWQTGEIPLSGGNLIYIIDDGIETKNAKGHWESYNSSTPMVSIGSDAFNFVNEKTITLNRFNSDSGTYKINDGDEIPFENGDTLNFGKDYNEGSTITLTLSAKKGFNTTSYEYVFYKVETITVYAKNDDEWDEVWIHYWGGTPATTWPGVKMSLVEDSEDVYEAQIPANTTNFKFNNGKNENSDECEQTKNLDVQSLVSGVSECYILKAGEFTTLEKALTNSPTENLPLIIVNNTESNFDSKFKVSSTLQNVEKVMGYIIEYTYDSSLIEPVIPENNEISTDYGTIYVNEIAKGTVRILYSGITQLDFSSVKPLVDLTFKSISNKTTQAKIKVNVKEMLSDENENIDFPSNNLVYGKVSIGVDKSVLKSKIDYAYSLNESDYSAVSYQNLLTALTNAELIYDSVLSTQDNVDKQVTLLTEALDSLIVSKPGNYFYFKNETGWDTVYAYWWGDNVLVTCPSFPGIKATKLEGTLNTYYIEVPEGASGLNFSNGITEGDGKQQTDSITSNIESGKMFVPNVEDSYEKNGGLRFRGTIEDYIPNNIYFKNVMNWDDVYVYWWGSSYECIGFPGIKASLLSGTTDIYYVTLPEDATGLNFNNGHQPSEGGEQTSSITTFEIGKIFIIDPDSAYEKNGGIRYNGIYDTLDNYIINDDNSNDTDNNNNYDDNTTDNNNDDNSTDNNNNNEGNSTDNNNNDTEDKNTSNDNNSENIKPNNNATTPSNNSNTNTIKTSDASCLVLSIICFSSFLAIFATRNRRIGGINNEKK